MGELVHLRFRGAEVDYDFLDDFEWTPALLAEYAERARDMAGRSVLLADTPRWPPGVCQDCRGPFRIPRAGRLRRYRVGRFLLCPAHAEARLRVRVALELGKAS